MIKDRLLQDKHINCQQYDISQQISHNQIEQTNKSIQQFQIPSILSSSIQSSHTNLLTFHHIKVLKLVTILSFCSLFITYRLLFQPNQFNNINQIHTIYDTYQQFTLNINKKILQYHYDNVILGIGQVIMDGWIVIALIFWVAKVHNFRFPFAIGSFYGIRSIFLQIQAFPFPSNIIWHNPGFYSLTVPYDHTRDFFYSGHTGCLIIILLQLSQITIRNPKYGLLGYIWIVTFISLVYMMNMLIITHVHYTVDVVGAVMYSGWFYYISQKYIKYVDKLGNLPYQGGKFVYEKIIFKKINKQNNSQKDTIIFNQKKDKIILNQVIIYQIDNNNDKERYNRISGMIKE